MINFTDKITLTYTGADEMYRENPLWIRTRVFADRLSLKPDEYFVFELKPDYTDGASIIRILWCFITPTDWRILVPSQPHDYMYKLLGENKNTLTGLIWNKRTGKIVKKNVIVKFNRKDADKLIEEKMVSYGGGFILRKGVYYSLRPFGYFVIKNKLKKYDKRHNKKI